MTSMAAIVSAEPAVYAEIDAVLADVSANKLGLVAGADKLEKLFSKADLLYETDINCRFVGFDPANRDGEGGNAKEVLALAADIADLGWSWPATAHALCVEVVPGDSSVEDFNKHLCEDAGLAPVERDSIRFGSLSCGHTNMGLRAIQAGVATTSELLGEDGFLSLGKLERIDAEYAKAVRQGLHWKVLRHSVRARFPEALHIMQATLHVSTAYQAARNVAGHVQRPEHAVQGLCRLHREAVPYMEKGEVIDWTAIRRKVLRSKPPYESQLDDLIAFVAGKSGGLRGEYLQFLRAFHRLYVEASARHMVPSGLYRVLADFPHQYLAFAILECAFGCPEEFVKGGVCSWVTVGEVTALAKPATTLLAEKLSGAEACLREARLRLSKCGVLASPLSDNKLLKLFVRLDVSVARFVLGKQDKSKNPLSCVDQAGLSFLEHLRAAYPSGDLSPFDGLWQMPVTQAVATEVSAAEASAIPISEIDATGKVVSARARLRAEGYEVKMTFAHKEALGQVWRLIAVQDPEGLVRLEALERSEDGGLPQKEVKVEAFLEEWALADKTLVVQRHPGWPSREVSLTKVALAAQHRGWALAALGHLSLKLRRSLALESAVDIHLKPSRRVIAKRDFAPGALVLAPETPHVKSLDSSEAGPSGGMKVAFTPEEASHGYWLLPAVGNDCVAPFWFVASCAEEPSGNMVSASFVVSFLTGADYAGEVALADHFNAPPRRLHSKASADSVQTLVVSIPVLVNKTALAAGDELRVYRPPAAKRSKPSGGAAITLAGLSRAKKSKTEGA